MIKRIFIRLTILAILLVFITPSISLSAQERRIALVIGNGAYKSSPLRNPVNDATDIAYTIRNLGFSVILKTNANQRTMEESIRDFGKALRLGGVGLFYFAGHGLQIKGRNYLLPIGADVYEENDMKYEAVDAGRVLDVMDSAGNMLNIVILDACRDNPFARSFRSSTSGLARMDTPKGSLIAYSTSPGKVALDGSRRNSPYTEVLLKNIQVPDLTIEQVFKQTRKDIDILTAGKQTPWESTSLIGDFYFASKRGITIAERPKTKTQYSSELYKERERLESERQELEKLKIELEKKKLEAERKRIEDEKKKLLAKETKKYASISSEVSKAKIIDRDRHFYKYDTGVVYDKKTGLEWVAGPDKDTDRYEAKRWVYNLNVEGGGWRMPTTAELKTLYKEGAGSRNMTPLLKTTGWYVLSSETDDRYSAWDFHFPIESSGWFLNTLFEDAGHDARGFAVRLKPATLSQEDKKITNSLGMELVYIKPGTFMMGSPSGEKGRMIDDWGDYERQHKVPLTKGFYMQTTEVTQGQWRAVMGSNPSYFKNCGDDCPVEKVSWYDVQKFIKKLNQREGSDTYRLPTEAEWEYACRAGSTTAFANGGISELKCGYDSNLNVLGWYCGNSGVSYNDCVDESRWDGPKCAGTHPVAQKQSNIWGLYDMHGNVSEWCQDWYKREYPLNSVINPIGPSGGTSRVVRGGCWGHEARHCRSAKRHDNNPYRGGRTTGFRLLRNLRF